MNKKAGLYIGAIALAALALIATISFNSISGAGAFEGGAAKAMLGTKWEMQNAQFVAGKTIADALADSSYSPTSCGYDAAKAATKVNTYLAAVKNQAFGACDFSVLSITGSGNPANVTVSLRIACEKDSGSLKASYTKTISFKKKVETSGNCRVIVTNTDAAPIIEVDQTEP